MGEKLMAPFSVLVTPQAMFQRRSEVEDFFGDGYVIEFSGAPINDQAKLKERLADKDAAVLGVEKIDSEFWLPHRILRFSRASALATIQSTPRQQRLGVCGCCDAGKVGPPSCGAPRNRPYFGIGT